MVSQFVHLNVHTEYSIVDGTVRIPELLTAVKEQNMPAVAVTDHVNLFSLVKFYRQALSQGVKPIIGATMLLADDQEKNHSKFTALCINQQGYKNLTQLMTKAYVARQETGKEPVVSWAWLEELSAGLIILSGAKDGDIGQAIMKGKNTLATQHALRWQKTFQDNFYMELRRTGRPQEEDYLHEAIKISEANQIPVVATQDVCFINKDDFESHEARVCIYQGWMLDDARRPHDYSNQQYLTSNDYMLALFKDVPSAIENTVEIAKRCNVQLELGKAYLPEFPIPAGKTLESYCYDKAQQGLKERLDILSANDIQYKESDYQDRLKMELDVISNMGFLGYFLIVADFIRWAKEQDIPVGPGRGSGAGSLIAYVYGITELDPLVHGLLFERFLNPERVSLPDFDIDFCMDRRDEVIDYVGRCYGQECVSQIITYGRMSAKAVIRDVGRVLSLSYGFVDTIAKLIPFELGITLDKALEDEPELGRRYDEEEEVASLINLARKLEGLTRNAGKHAGGVVIAPTQLTDFTPLYCEAGGDGQVTQFDKDDVEAVGLVKFDFLGLRTLTIIHWALQHVNKKRDKAGQDAIDIHTIDLADKKVFDLLKACNTTAVFQLESRGMRELVGRLKPDCFDEITALVALFRPGPLQSGMVDDFIDRKHGRSPVHYPHPDLEWILKPTYGVILYQEQVMQIAQVLSGYSLGKADLLRRAMGKKKAKEMAEQRSVFVGGAGDLGVDKKLAGQIFDLIEKFAGYGFNKSHSAAYALLSYQTAWIKAHYPAEFMAAVLSSDMDNTDKVLIFVEECQRMKLDLLSPNVNAGHYYFTVTDKGEIVYGLGAVKGVGEAAVEDLMQERQAGGEFKDLFDFCRRVDIKKMNRRSLEPLIYSGAMDVFGETRATLLASLNDALQLAEQKSRDEAQGQGNLFGDFGAFDGSDESTAVSYSVKSEWALKDKLEGEKNSLGYYLSGHPISAYEKEISQFCSKTIAEILSSNKKQTLAVGLVVSARVIMTQRGKRMGILTLSDKTAKIDVTVFSEVLDESPGLLQKDSILIVDGELADDKFSGGKKITAKALYSFDGARKRWAKRLVIKTDSDQDVKQIIKQLPKMINSSQGGQCPIFIDYSSKSASVRLKLGKQWCVNPTEVCLEELCKVLSADGAVCLEYR